MTLTSLGYVTMASPPAAKRLTANETDPTRRVRAQAISVVALPTNTTPVYVGTANMNISSGVGVYDIIPAPTDPTTGPYPSWSPSMPLAPVAFNAEDIYVYSETAGEGVVVAVVAN